MSELLERITIEEGKCGGKPCIRGMRITVDIVVMMLMDATGDEIIADFPYLERDDLRAAIEYVQQQLDKARGNIGEDRVARFPVRA